MRKLTAIALATGVAIAGAGIFTLSANADQYRQGRGGPGMNCGMDDGERAMGRGQRGERGERGRGMECGEGSGQGFMRHHGGERGGSERGWGRDGGQGGEFARHHGRRGKDGQGRMGRRGGKGGQFGPGMFDRLDADKDGAVTLEEASKMKMRGGRRMARLDTDKNGEITSSEIDAWQSDMRENLLERLDTNNDGKIDKSDRDAKIKQRFDRFDADKDGKVTREEVAELMGGWRQHRREFMKKMRQEFWGSGSE